MKFRDTNIISVIREFNLPLNFGTNFKMKNYVLILEIINESPNRLCIIFEARSFACPRTPTQFRKSDPRQTQSKVIARVRAAFLNQRAARIFQNSLKKDFCIDNARLFHFEHSPLSSLTVRWKHQYTSFSSDCQIKAPIHLCPLWLSNKNTNTPLPLWLSDKTPIHLFALWLSDKNTYTPLSPLTVR